MNDGLVQYLGDDSFFMEAKGRRTIEFMIRNDSACNEPVKKQYGAWNSELKIITI